MDDYNVNINNKVVISGQAEIDRLEAALQASRAEVDRLNSQLEYSRDEIRSLRTEIDELARSSGFSALQEKLETFKMTAQDAAREFEAFLTNSKLIGSDGRYDYQFREYFKAIEQGSMTASQAITEVKNEYRALLEESMRRGEGLFDAQMIQQFTASLNSLSDTVNTVLTKVTQIQTNGVSVNNEIASSGGNVATTLNQIRDAAMQMDGDLKGAYESIAKLATALSSYANVDDGKIIAISQTFKNVADIGKGGFSTKQVENIISLCTRLQTISNGGNGIRFRIDGLDSLQGLKVSKASLSNLAEYLPQIASVDTARLQAVANIDWSNLQNLKISKSAIENVSKLSTLANMLDEVRQKVEKLEAAEERSAEKLYSSQLGQITKQQNALTKAGGVDNTDYKTLNADLSAYAEKVRSLFAEFSRTKDLSTFRAEMVKLGGEFEQTKAKVEAYTASQRKNTDEQKRNAEASKESERLAKQRLSGLTQYNSVYRQINTALQSYTAAERSRNAESRTAYSNIQKLKADMEGYKTALSTGKMNEDDFAQAVKRASVELNSNINVIRANGDATLTWSSRLSGLAQKFAYWFSASHAIMLAIRSVRQMISASIDLDKAMTDLKIVTNETDSTYQQFADDIANTAQQLGASMTDLIDATTTYARLGYDLDQSQVLASLTAQLQNVGNIEAADAQDAVTAMIKAFDDIDPSNLEQAMDKLVKVGNNAPISVSQIAEGMNNASSALSAAGNSFEESVALLTAANTTIQNASRSSTGLRTIAARIRNVKAELDELGETMTTAQYDEIVQALTKIQLADGTFASVSLTDVNGELRSTYDIIKDIAAVWDQMSANEQAAMAKTLAGTRQQDVFFSLINQFTEASKAMDLMANSAGTLSNSYNEYLDSTTAHITSMKVAFQKLGADIFQSDFLKGIVDFATHVLNALDLITNLINKLGGLQSVLISIGGLVAAIKIQSIAALLTKLIGPVKSVIAVLSRVPVVLASFTSGTAVAVQGTSRLQAALTGLGITATSVQIAIAALFAAIAIGTAIYNKWKQSQEEARQEAYAVAEAAEQEYNSVKDSYKAYLDAREAYKDHKGSKAELETATNALIQILGIEDSQVQALTGDYEALDNMLKEVSAEKIRQSLQEFHTGYDQAAKDFSKKMDFGGLVFQNEREFKKMLAESGYDFSQVEDLINSDDFTYYVHFAVDDTESAREAHDILQGMLDSLEQGAQEGKYTLDDMMSSEIYKQVTAQLNAVDDEYKQYLGYIDKINNAQLELDIDKWVNDDNIPETTEQYNRLVDSIVNAAESSGLYVGTTEDINRAVTHTLASMPEFESYFDSIKTAVSECVDTLDQNKVSFSDLFTDEEGKDTEFKDTIDEYVDKVKKLEDTLEKLEDDKLSPADRLEFIDNFPELAGKTDNLAESIRALIIELTGHGSISEEKLNNINRAYRKYIADLEDVKKLGFSPTEHLFGNIDLDKREAFKWTDELIEQYKDAIASWGQDIQAGDISTVLGSAATFTIDGADYDIAFTPMLKTKTGYDYLDESTVGEYLRGLINKASEDGKWSFDEILSLDAEGMEINGKMISNLVAGMSEAEGEARNLSEVMHYLGKDGSIAQNFEELTKYVEDAGLTMDEFNEMVEENGIAVGDATGIIAAFEAQFGRLESAEDVQKLREYMKTVVELGQVVGATKFSIDIETETDSMDKLWAAMKESVTSTGLTSESVKNLKERYQDLDSYDPAKLFERTANGIHLNTSALRELESEYEKQKKSEIADHLDDLVKEYNDLGEKIKNSNNALETYNLYQERASLQKQIEETSILAAQYDGLTSAFHKWEEAQSIGEEGDLYDSLAGGLKDIKELYDQGLVGTNKFRTAVQLMSNEDLGTASVEELIAAYDSGLPKIERYFTEGQEGAQHFLEDVQNLNSEWAHMNEDGSWEINFGLGNDQEIADKLGINVESVQAILRKLSDYGFDINLDSPISALADMTSEAEKASEKLQELGKLNYHVNLESDDLDTINQDLLVIEGQLKTVQDEDGKIDLSAPGAQELETLFVTLMTKKQILTAPAIMQINTEQLTEADNGIAEAIKSLQEFVTLSNTLEIQAKLGEDTTETQQRIQEISGTLSEIPPEVMTSIGIDQESLNASLESIKNTEVDFDAGVAIPEDDIKAVQDAIDGIDPKDIQLSDNSASIIGDMEKVEKYTIHDKDYSVSISNYYAHWTSLNNINNFKFDDKYQHIYQVKHTVNEPSKADGTAHSRGTARSVGDWGIKGSGTALGGEEGEELLVRDGRYYIIGKESAGFFDFKDGDIIFNADQTEQIFKYGRIRRGNRRGKTYADGTAFSSGTGKFKQTVQEVKGDVTTTPTSNPTKNTDDKDKKAIEKFKEWFSKLFDWIEIKLERTTDKISRYIASAERKKDVGSYKSAAKNYYSAIKTTTSLEDYERRGAAKYNKTANSVLRKAVNGGIISQKMADTIKKRVKDGTIDISEYSEDIQEVIKDYQQWYDKMAECKNSLAELHENIRTYVKDLKELRDAQRDANVTSLQTRLDIGNSGLTSSTGSKALANSQLSYANSVAKSRNEAYSTAVTNSNKDVNKLRGSAAAAARKESKTKNKAYKKALKEAQKAMKSKKTVPYSVLKVIRKNSIATYEKIYAYNLALENLEVAKMERATEYASNSAEIYQNIAEMYSNKDESSNNRISLNRAKSENAKSVKNKNKYLSKVASEYDTILNNDLAEIDRYSSSLKSAKKVINKANSALRGAKYKTLSSKYKKSVNSAIDKAQAAAKSGKPISASLLATLAKYYSKGYITASFYNSCIDYNNAFESLNEAKAQYEIDKQTAKSEKAAIGTEMVSNIEQKYQNRLNTLEARKTAKQTKQNLKKARGIDLSKADYEDLITQSKKERDIYLEEANAVEAQINKNLKEGYWTEGSQEYKDAVIAMKGYKNSANECLITIEELTDALRDDVLWRTFERAQESAERLRKVLDGIDNLIDDSILFDKDGRLTEYGVAHISNLVDQYDNAITQVKNYSDQIKNLTKLYNDGMYTELEYKEKLGDLRASLLNSASDVKSVMDTIIDMYKDMAKSELDNLFKLIDARKKALDSKKEYYEYDKNIKKQTDDILAIKAQIAALEGIEGAVAKSKRAQLQAQLKEAQDALDDTVNNHILDISKEALDEMKETMQDAFDDKWDMIGSDLEEIKKLMKAANDLAESSTRTTESAINALLSLYGVNYSVGQIVDNNYASGTKRVPRKLRALVGENGQEVITTKSGLILTLNPGDGVIPADMTKNLMAMANGVLPLSNMQVPSLNQSLFGRSAGAEIVQHYDSLINIEGSADAATVEDLKRMKSDLLEDSYNYTSNRLYRGYVKAGGKRIV